MSAKYRTVVTTAGAVKLAAAAVPGGKKVNLTVMAVGDGGGSLPEPNASQTKLVNEVWRHALNKISQDNKKKNYIVAELVIPPEVGGFWARELGLYDDAGTLIAVANMAESYKPELAEGSGRAQTCRMVIILSSIESVELSIDSTTVMATQDYVDDKITEHEQSRRHPNATLKEKGFVQLSSATDSTSEALAATPKAVKVAYDLANAKYTAQDATTARKGIVQLSSTTDSESETLAATPKAVKAANDNANGRVPSNRKVNGKELSSDITLSADDVVAVPVAIRGTIVDGKTMASANVTGWWTVAVKDTKTVSDFPKYPDGSALYGYGYLFVDKAGNTWLQHYYGHHGANAKRQSWSESSPAPNVSWEVDYNTANKPTAADVGALSASGGKVTGEVKLTGSNVLRIYSGDYGVIFRRSENNIYLIPTEKGKAENGDIGSLRPFSIDLSTGIVSMTQGLSLGKALPVSSGGTGSTTASGARAALGCGAAATMSYSTAVYTQLAGSETEAASTKQLVGLRNAVYTKTEGDARYQAKGNYTPAGQAYTKSESDGRFLNWNYNAIGSVCFARFDPQNQTIAPNGTTAGSNLHAAGITGYPDAVGGDWMALRVSGTLSGTWRCLGSIQNDTDSRGYRHYSVSLFVRIA